MSNGQYHIFIHMNTCKKCNQTFPNRTVVDGQLRILHSRKFCLSCSPFGNRNTKSLETEIPGMKWCPRCQTHLMLTQFYNRRGGIGNSAYCRKCLSDQSVERTQHLKMKAVAYKGGKCQNCGYSKSLAAFDFHHRNPKEKEFAISNVKWKNFDRIKPELDKCDLLCSNCHREVHDQNRGLTDPGKHSEQEPF